MARQGITHLDKSMRFAYFFNIYIKPAFLLASYQLRVSEDWVVADEVICETVSPQFPNLQGNFSFRLFCRNFSSLKHLM
jgi:hypothetical protein